MTWIDNLLFKLILTEKDVMQVMNYNAAVSSFSKYRSKITIEETVMFCLRVMVGVIILYDHVHPVGAFAKSSPIAVSKFI
jgi:CYRIA/CYRIB Rac1 binding domain